MVLQLLDFVGVFVFALSGGVLAARKDLDLFGFVVLALMPAVGGGTLRDLILDTPVFWLLDTRYLFVTLVAALVSFLLHNYLTERDRVLRWLDAAGLSLFCVLGASKALQLTHDPVIAVMMGVMTAVAGGIVRDTIANDLPLILRREVYATAAFAGAVVFVGMELLRLPGAVLAGMAKAARFESSARRRAVTFWITFSRQSRIYATGGN